MRKPLDGHNHIFDDQCGESCPKWVGQYNPDSEPSVDPEYTAAHAVIADWWRDIAEEEINKVVAKAVEYGSTDLYEVGRALGLVFGWEGMSHEEAVELGIYFYELGKFARWTDAIRNRRRVSDDTLHDLGVYVRMAQRNRAVGGWPFNPGEKA